MPNHVSQNPDWFVSAIITNGTVGDSLGQVLQQIQRKESFVKMLQEKISEKRGSALDQVTDLCMRTRVLETTVKYRTSILNPERRGAWFRTSLATANGPFSGSILPDAIFANYDENKSSVVRLGLVDCWNKKNLMSYPMKPTDSCLWKILLTLNFEWHELGKLGAWPRLEHLPDELPADLESRSLRAFLTNVKAEYLSAREILASAYKILLGASDQFWAVRSKFRNGENDDVAYDGFRSAESVRQEFRKRRATPTIKRPMGKSTSDLEALKFMGFDDFPLEADLKQRYHALAMTMHPDRAGGNEARFKLLSKSYKHLLRVCER